MWLLISIIILRLSNTVIILQDHIRKIFIKIKITAHGKRSGTP